MTIDPASPLGFLISALVIHRRALDSPPIPPFQRPEGADDASWSAQIEAARSAHDRFALRFRKILDDVSSALFGAGVSRLPELPVGAAPSAQTVQETVPVDTRLGLRDIVPHALPLPPKSAQPPFPVPELVDIPIQIHSSATAERGPCIISMHGGAFWMGGGAVAQEFDGPGGIWMARAVRGTVIDVDYRLAPEHPYPASIVDLIAVLDWVRAHSDELNVDPARIALLGVSSGGNIAAIAAIVDAAREIDAPQLAAQVLIVPSLNLAEITKEQSMSEAGVKGRHAQILGYLGVDINPVEPFVSPVMGAPITGLPATVVVTADYDEVALGGAEWADQLRAAGVPVTHLSYPMTHTISTPATSARMTSEMAAALIGILESVNHAPELRTAQKA